MAAVAVWTCPSCDRWVAPRSAWSRWPAVRARFLRHGCRGLCCTCYRRLASTDAIHDYQPSNMSRDELLDEWALLRSEGISIPDAAPRLGMTIHALARALARARRDGDPRAQFDWRGVHAALRDAS